MLLKSKIRAIIVVCWSSKVIVVSQTVIINSMESTVNNINVPVFIEKIQLDKGYSNKLTSLQTET